MLETVERLENQAFPAMKREKVNLNVKSVRFTDKQFWDLCADNPDLSFELSARGELIIVPPTLPDTGRKNSDLTTDVTIWARQNKTGIVFDSSTIFTLPSGAKRAPDLAWLRSEKWDALAIKERRKTSKLVPDFVIELRSSSDSLAELKAKRQEYIANGVTLGWLIDPQNRKVHIYRADGDIEILDDPKKVAGESFLTGFELDLETIFD